LYTASTRSAYKEHTLSRDNTVLPAHPTVQTFPFSTGSAIDDKHTWHV